MIVPIPIAARLARIRDVTPPSLSRPQGGAEYEENHGEEEQSHDGTHAPDGITDYSRASNGCLEKRSVETLSCSPGDVEKELVYR